MSLFKDEAITLRRLDYSETSQVLAVLCREHGAQRLIAKGIKRGTKTRVAVGVDLLEWGHVVFSRRPESVSDMSIMTEWRQIDAFVHLRRDLPRLYCAQYAAEAAAQLTEVGDPHPALFDALRRLFESMIDSASLARLVGFLKNLLREIGLAPQFRQCVACRRAIDPATAVYFTSRGGGVVCRDCEPALFEKFRVAPHALAALASGAGEPPGDPRAAWAAFEVLDYHLCETLGRRLRLSEPVRAVCRPG